MLENRSPSLLFLLLPLLFLLLLLLLLPVAEPVRQMAVDTTASIPIDSMRGNAAVESELEKLFPARDVRETDTRAKLQRCNVATMRHGGGPEAGRIQQQTADDWNQNKRRRRIGISNAALNEIN